MPLLWYSTASPMNSQVQFLIGITCVNTLIGFMLGKLYQRRKDERLNKLNMPGLDLLRDWNVVVDGAHKAQASNARLVKLLSQCLPRLSARLMDSAVDVELEGKFVGQVRDVLDEAEKARMAVVTAEKLLAYWGTQVVDVAIVDRPANDVGERLP